MLADLVENKRSKGTYSLFSPKLKFRVTVHNIITDPDIKYNHDNHTRYQVTVVHSNKNCKLQSAIYFSKATAN